MSVAKATASNAGGRHIITDEPRDAGGGSARGGGTLRERLEARHHSALQQFQAGARIINREADARQVERAQSLRVELTESHALVAAILDAEKQKIEQHKTFLGSYEAQCKSAVTPGALLPVFIDEFHMISDHTSAGDGVSGGAGLALFDASIGRMREERLRVLQVAVTLRESCRARMDSIEQCSAALEEEEHHRRESVQASLRDLMLALAKISYTSITSSHALAQRVIHSVNEEIAANYMGIKTLLCQLSQRELLKQERYSATMQAIYQGTQERMALSQLWWARTLLQSVEYRRPASRARHVERVHEISAVSRRDATQFLRSLGMVVGSLRHSREVQASTLHGELECGGSGQAGWLRHYDPALDSAVFTSDPMEVVDEWRMKANVVLRNGLSVCTALIDEIKRSECARGEATAVLKSALLFSIEWAFTPLEEEPQLLLDASINVGEVDASYTQFTCKGVASISGLHSAVDQALDSCTRQIALEGEWFGSTVEKGLLQSHTFFEETLLLAYRSVLRIFEKATEELVITATEAIDCARAFYRKRREAHRDHEDALLTLEEMFAQVTERMLNAGSVAAAEDLFVDGLQRLEEIAQAHTLFHRSTVDDLSTTAELTGQRIDACCQRLLTMIGVESITDTESRLATERQRKVEDAMAHLVQEQALHSKKKVKRTASMDEVSSTSSQPVTLSMMMEDIPLEEPNYPQVTAPDGTVFNITGPLTLVKEGEGEERDGLETTDNLPGATTGGTFLKAAKSFISASSPGSARHTTSSVPAASSKKRGGKHAQRQHSDDESHNQYLSMEFVESYQPLFADTIMQRENFISRGDVTAWCELVRTELLGWTTNLRRSTQQHVTSYCSASKAAIDRETNELLRHHRRRPATFQADVYECRVRELENRSNTSEKYCARLQERMTKVEGMWQGLHSNPAYVEADAALLADLQGIQGGANGASSLSVLQVQERRFNALCGQYVDSFELRSRQVAENVQKQRDLIEAECLHYLDERAAVVAAEENGKGVTLEKAIARDVLSQRVRGVLERLAETVSAVTAYVAEELEARRRAVAEARNAYSVTRQRNSSELQLLTQLQELHSRLKTQVQSSIMQSFADEGKLNAAITELEEKAAKPLAHVHLGTTLHRLMQQDYTLGLLPSSPLSRRSVAARSSGSDAATAASLPADSATKAEGHLQQLLQATRVHLQRQTRASEAAELLGLVDRLRPVLFQRGASLAALQYAVELAKVAAEYYVDPRPLLQDSEAAAAAQAQSTGSSRGKRAKGGGGGGGAGGKPHAVQYDPLPPVTTIDTLVQQWSAEFKSEAAKAAQTHFEHFPEPLLRRPPGLEGGTADDLLAFVDALCVTQGARAAEHVGEATRTYHRQVQRVHLALQGIPQYLSTAVLQVTARCMERRVGDVMETFGDLYSRSSQAKAVNKTVVKVSLGNKYNRERLQQLDERECVRQRVTADALERFWGLAVREVQDEVGMHTARCVNTANILFLLIKGIVAPEHLMPCEDAVLDVGHHRGLKHLMKMREQGGRLKEVDPSTSAAKRERRLQETMPLLKQDLKASAKEKVVAGDSGLLVPVYNEVEYIGIPLNTFKPLDDFNEMHPRHAVPAPTSIGAFYSLSTDAAASGWGVAGGGKAGSGGATNKRRSVQESMDDAVALSPPFVVPATRMHQETLALTRQSVAAVQAMSLEVVGDVGRSFDAWEQRETQWGQSWSLTVKKLSSGNAHLSAGVDGQAGLS